MWYTVFVFVWLMSLSICLPDPPCCCQWQNFLFSLGWIIFQMGCVYHIFAIHSSIDSLLSCFLILAAMNNAAVNIDMQTSFWDTNFNSFEYISKGGIARSYTVVQFLISFRNHYSVFHIGLHPFTFPHWFRFL